MLPNFKEIINTKPITLLLDKELKKIRLQTHHENIRKLLYYKKIQIIKSLIKTIVFDIQYEIHKQTQQK